jgi:hypothetical protein
MNVLTAVCRNTRKERDMNDEQTHLERPEAWLEDDGRPRSRTLNGGLDPAEMGRRSGRVRRERKARRESPVLITPSASDAVIEDALRRKAESGDVAAARALIDWQAKRAVEGASAGNEWLDELSPEARHEILDIIVRDTGIALVANK